MYMPFFFDPTMLILLPAVAIAIYAQYKVKSAYNKYSDIKSKSGFTGADIAQKLLKNNNINDVQVKRIEGDLNDHYDPKEKVLNLSDGVYGSNSLAAIGIAAHEAGHAIQDYDNYKPLSIRAKLVPAANIGSQAGLPLAIFGFFLQSQIMIGIGFVVFLAAVFFQIVTLPVEFNASNRAIQQLNQNSYLDSNELQGAKKVLRAAAFTYVAATLVAFANLLRIAMLFGMGRRD
ncbi:MAG TPA: zinc metallopeptidase [Halanaerobiales bacterium]|nr:zinc metallopeptidase [Halanaerobiales bacterium]